MSTESIKQALEERDQALEAKFAELAGENEKLSTKNLELGDRLAELEQKGSPGLDYHGAPEKVSLQKVLKHLISPRDNPLDGKEAEWHQELSNKSGKDFPGAVWIPLQTKAGIDWGSSSPTSGASNLVPTSTLDLIDVLRQVSVVLQQGVTLIPAEGQVSVPRKSADSTAYWISGDSEDITLSNPTFEALTLEPKFVGGLVSISLRMMTQTGAEIERIIERDLMGMIAEEVDLKALQGTGANNQPTGILNATGIGSLTWGGGASPLEFEATRFWFNDAADMEENLINSKAYTGNLSYLLDAATYKQARYDKDTNGADQFCIDPKTKKLFGLPVTPTTNMPANTALLGNWQEFLMATYGGIALMTDPYGTSFASGDVRVRAIMPLDFGVRHGASFVKNVKP